MNNFRGYGLELGEAFTVGRFTVKPAYLLGKNRRTGEFEQLCCHLRDGAEIDESHEAVAGFMADCEPAQWGRQNG